MAKKFSEQQMRMSRQGLELADKLYEHHLQQIPLHKLSEVTALSVRKSRLALPSRTGK
ncbi:MAG TPA: hypothetical protein VF671_12835 [Pseudomonas sp.]|jgi:hypothetical protein|uniref:hypothetical protein n=1 Tax=Pseudomonas sp. TaxID=306 RepID=UPI002ED7C50C